MRPLNTVLLLTVLIAVYAALEASGALVSIADPGMLRAWVDDAGWLGPLLVIGLIAGAIVFSPLPSAPIALASGAAFGHAWGTLYIVIGAELGALAAFFIARRVGRPVLRRWFGEGVARALPTAETAAQGGWRRLFTGLGSQNGLTAVVLFSRLMPFLSFDLVSYAAGLTPLTAARFALATLAGVVPVSFLLAHVGEEFGSAAPTQMLTAALLLGLVTGVPLLLLRSRRWLIQRARPLSPRR